MRWLLPLVLVATVSADGDGRPWGAPGPAKTWRHPSDEEVQAARAADLALKWLAAHQDAQEGRWDPKGFMKHDPVGDRCDGAGDAQFEVGLTALSLLAFLNGGFTDRGAADENPYAETVQRGLQYLIASQDKEGCFGRRTTHAFMYNHAIATLVLCDAFAMTGDPRYAKPAENGAKFIVAAQNPGAGWRYDPRGGESDTSITAWCTTALRAGHHCGFRVPRQSFDDAAAWVTKMTEPNFGQVGYNYPGGACCRPEGTQDAFPPEKSQAMTAAGTWVRFLAGREQGTDAIRKATRLCLEQPPAWDPDGGTIDMYYWYFGTLALHQVGGEEWKTWRAKLRDAVVSHQRSEGARAGSWDPIDVWASTAGGRIYSTALLALCVEVPYRYRRGLGDLPGR